MTHGDSADAGHHLALGQVAMANHPLAALFRFERGMLGQKLGDLRLDRLRQQGTGPVAQDLGERIGERPWLNQFGDIIGEVPPVVAHQYKGFVCAVRGRPDEALRLTRSALESAERLGHPITLAFARAIHAHVLMMRRDYADCLEMGEETFKLSTAHGLVFWAADTEILEGVAMANLDRSEGGLERAEHGLKNWIANGAQLHIPTWSALIAEAALFLEQYERAGELLIHATRVSDRTGDFFARAELERLYGRLLLVAGKRSDGQSSLERALALARRQGATLFELRAAMDLAEMFVRNSDSKRARDILAPIVETYHEHREGADYRFSIALLDKIVASKPSM